MPLLIWQVAKAHLVANWKCYQYALSTNNGRIITNKCHLKSEGSRSSKSDGDLSEIYPKIESGIYFATYNIDYLNNILVPEKIN
jgi:hypothetical protein